MPRLSKERTLHGLVETADFINAARDAGLSDADRQAIVERIASSPQLGDLIPGTGGARKVRFAGRGKGKSGGFRVISYFAGPDIPVFLLTLFAKGERVDLTQAERNQMRRELSGLADDYRRNTRARKIRP
jgi:hypothetical protein